MPSCPNPYLFAILPQPHFPPSHILPANTSSRLLSFALNHLPQAVWLLILSCYELFRFQSTSTYVHRFRA